MSTVSQMYAPSKCIDSEDINNDTFRTGLSSSNSNMLPLQCSANIGNIPTNAKQVRREFMNYFNTDGQVPKQDNYRLEYLLKIVI